MAMMVMAMAAVIWIHTVLLMMADHSSLEYMNHGSCIIVSPYKNPVTAPGTSLSEQNSCRVRTSKGF